MGAGSIYFAIACLWQTRGGTLAIYIHVELDILDIHVPLESVVISLGYNYLEP